MTHQKFLICYGVTTKFPSPAHAARWFHALSDQTRLEIVRRLSHGERCVCDLMDELDVAQSRLSFHLKTLKEAGLVKDRREGRWVFYSLCGEVLEEIAAMAAAVKPGSHAGSRVQGCCR